MKKLLLVFMVVALALSSFLDSAYGLHTVYGDVSGSGLVREKYIANARINIAGEETVSDSLGVFWLVLPNNKKLDHVVVSATADGYNDYNAPDEILRGCVIDGRGISDTTWIGIGMFKPECQLLVDTVAFDTVAVKLESGGSVTIDFQMTNPGKGVLDWSLEKNIQSDTIISPWERRESLPVGQILGLKRVAGAVFVADQWFVAGGSRAGDGKNMIYILSSDLAVLDSFRQPGDSRLGLSDLAYNGELLWGADGNAIEPHYVYGFDLKGKVQKRFSIPYQGYGIAWDSDRNQLIIGGRKDTDPIRAYDQAGNFVKEYVGKANMWVTGLAFYPDDPDGCQLYIYHSPGDMSLWVAKMNLDNLSISDPWPLTPPEGGEPSGCFITNQLDLKNWVCVVTVDDSWPVLGSDRIDIWQLGVRRDWFSIQFNGVEQGIGQLPAGESFNGQLLLSAKDLPVGVYAGEVIFHFNGRQTALSVEMEIVDPQAVRTPILPIVVSMNAYPNPFNSVTTIRYSTDRTEHLTIRAYDLSGRVVATLINAPAEIGVHEVMWNADNFSSGVYIIRMESGGRISTQKIALIK